MLADGEGVVVRKLILCLGILAGLAATPAQAAGIPMDEAGFSAYVQQKLQLYAPAPIYVVGPYSLTMGSGADARPLPSIKPLHDACVSAPANCESATHEYVQDTAHDVLQKPAGSAAATPAPAGSTTLFVCNGTARDQNIASVYMPVASDKWRSSGWTLLPVGKCMGILQTTNSVFYARAEETNRNLVHDEHVRDGMADSDSGIANSGGDISLCVPHTGNWDITSADLDGICGGNASERTRFKTFHADGKPAHVWKLGES